MKRAFFALALVTFFGVGCNDGSFSGCLSPTSTSDQDQDHDNDIPTPAPTAVPTPLPPGACAPTGTACVGSVPVCCSLDCGHDGFCK